MKKIIEQQFSPYEPIFALIDHLNGISSSFALNYYKSFEQAFEASVKEYGIDELKSYFKEEKFGKSIKKRMEKVLKEIDIVEKIADHDGQDYINFQDELNKISVGE